MKTGLINYNRLWRQLPGIGRGPLVYHSYITHSRRCERGLLRPYRETPPALAHYGETRLPSGLE